VDYIPGHALVPHAARNDRSVRWRKSKRSTTTMCVHFDLALYVRRCTCLVVFLDTSSEFFACTALLLGRTTQSFDIKIVAHLFVNIMCGAQGSSNSTGPSPAALKLAGVLAAAALALHPLPGT
jgi:hypothetical protein